MKPLEALMLTFLIGAASLSVASAGNSIERGLVAIAQEMAKDRAATNEAACRPVRPEDRAEAGGSP